MFYPEERIISHQAGMPLHFEVLQKKGKNGIIVEAIAHINGTIRSKEVRETVEKPVQTHMRRVVRMAFYRLLLFLTKQEEKPWGILTGVRPTKVVQRLIDEEVTGAALTAYLNKEYGVSSSKTALLEGIIARQTPFFEAIRKEQWGINLYIGIPFCPSRCHYCSFPSYDANRFANRIPLYLQTLEKELLSFFEGVQGLPIHVDSIYIGGGTPTVLNAEQLHRLLEVIKLCTKGHQVREITLEAGRPDTLTEEKMTVAKNFGVHRISVNPQTMQQTTLDTVGRKHSIAQVVDAVFMARQMDFTINMDLILGLPNETLDHVADTLEKIIIMKPHNITAHMLSLKTAAPYKKCKPMLPALAEVKAMHELVVKKLHATGYSPYYLYRQKRILGDLENIGYSLEGHESWYNIMMMEERQTIIGFGAGAASKFINQDDQHIGAVYYQPKDFIHYMERANLVEDKIARIHSLLMNKGEKQW